MRQIGNNTGWMQPQDDDKASAYEDLLDRADRMRDEMLDRQMEEREDGKDEL